MNLSSTPQKHLKISRTRNNRISWDSTAAVVVVAERPEVDTFRYKLWSIHRRLMESCHRTITTTRHIIFFMVEALRRPQDQVIRRRWGPGRGTTTLMVRIMFPP